MPVRGFVVSRARAGVSSLKLLVVMHDSGPPNCTPTLALKHMLRVKPPLCTRRRFSARVDVRRMVQRRKVRVLDYVSDIGTMVWIELERGIHEVDDLLVGAREKVVAPDAPLRVALELEHELASFLCQPLQLLILRRANN
jgi:hypothetical protein